MKKHIILILFTTLATTQAFAAEKARKGNASTSSDRIATSRAASTEAPAASSSTSIGRFGLGLQTLSNFGGTDTALSAWIETGNAGSIQPLVAIGGTTPDLQFGLGAIYRHIVAGSRQNGFHVGAGAGFGTVASGLGNKFFFSLMGVSGFHFTVPQTTNILISLDAAAAFSKVEDASSNFSIDGLSPALGLSVHYLF